MHIPFRTKSDQRNIEDLTRQLAWMLYYSDTGVDRKEPDKDDAWHVKRSANDFFVHQRGDREYFLSYRLEVKGRFHAMRYMLEHHLNVLIEPLPEPATQ